MKRFIILPGEIYKNLKVIAEIAPFGKYRRFKTECIKCGIVADKNMQALFHCKTGCKCTNPNPKKGSKYSELQQRMYKIYSGMTQRCNNTKIPQYYLYGGRGIKCEWKTFTDFYEDMSSSYIKGMSIDRIDGEKNYCKENCRWADDYTQNNNRRNNIFVLPGVSICAWARENGITKSFYNIAAMHWKKGKTLTEIQQKYEEYKKKKKERLFRKQNNLTAYEYKRYFG